MGVGSSTAQKGKNEKEDTKTCNPDKMKATKLCHFSVQIPDDARKPVVTGLQTFGNKFVVFTDEGSLPEMRIWSILLLVIKSDLKWCMHLSRSLCIFDTQNKKLNIVDKNGSFVSALEANYGG